MTSPEKSLYRFVTGALGASLPPGFSLKLMRGPSSSRTESGVSSKLIVLCDHCSRTAVPFDVVGVEVNTASDAQQLVSVLSCLKTESHLELSAFANSVPVNAQPSTSSTQRTKGCARSMLKAYSLKELQRGVEENGF